MMSGIRGRAFIGIVVAVLSTATLVQVGTGDASEVGGGPVREDGDAPAPKASPFVVVGRPHGNRVTIGRSVEWCPINGEARGLPRFSGVKQVDTDKAVTLTAYLVARPANCLVERFVRRTVRIRGGLGGRSLFDGSRSPPVRRWPRGGPR
jgi:hypothetical protein